MLLFPTILITSLATASGWRLTVGDVSPVAVSPVAVSSAAGSPFAGSAWRSGVGLDHDAVSSLAMLAGLHGCTTLRGGLASHWALPCSPVPLEPLLPRWSLEWSGLSAASHPAPGSGGLGPGSGGFLHLDLLVAHHFGAGPEVAWIMPDAPHEDLLRQRLVTPGVGVWYSALASRLFLGVSANTWISTLGEAWFVNALSSEARVGFTL